jgi:putative transposase
MARLKRLVMAQLPHLVQQRLVGGGAGLADPADQQAYLAALRHCCDEHEVAVIAYALLTHSTQLVLVPRTGQSLGKMVQALTREFVGPFNRRHQRSGALWQSRFSSAPLESATELLGCVVYVEQAALRHGLVASAVEFAASSAAYHAGLRSDALMAAMPADSAYWRLGNTPFERDAAYRRLIDVPMRAADVQRIDATLLKGWALGSPAFLANIGALGGRRPSPKPRGRPSLGQQSA